MVAPSPLPARREVSVDTRRWSAALAAGLALVRLAEALRADGVGCEACHGAARGERPWLAIHTAPDQWRKKYEKNPHDPVWKEYSFTDLSDLRVQARTCAGCHVGAPEDAKAGVPGRD